MFNIYEKTFPTEYKEEQEILDSIITAAKLMNHEVLTGNIRNSYDELIGKYVDINYCELDINIKIYTKDNEVTLLRASMSDTLLVGDLGYPKEVSDFISSPYQYSYIDALKKIMTWLYIND
ncbi:hypothetical protein D3C71_1442140 [compost metagenome]